MYYTRAGRSPSSDVRCCGSRARAHDRSDHRRDRQVALVTRGRDGHHRSNSAYSPNIKERLDHSCALRSFRTLDRASRTHPGPPRLVAVGIEARARAHRPEYGGVREGEMWVQTTCTSPGRTSTRHNRAASDLRPRNVVVFAGEQSASRRRRWCGARLHAGRRSRSLCRRRLLLRAAARRNPRRNDRPSSRKLKNAARAQRRSTRKSPAGSSASAGCSSFASVTAATGSKRPWRARSTTASTRRCDRCDRRLHPEDRDGAQHPDRSPGRDGRAFFDHDGTSAQVDAPLNAVFGVTLSGLPLRAARRHRSGDPDEVKVHAPVGTLLTAGADIFGWKRGDGHAQRRRPAGAGAGRAPLRVGSVQTRMSNVMSGGVRGDGRSWSFYETNGCERARVRTSMHLCTQCHMTNTLNTPIEALSKSKSPCAWFATRSPKERGFGTLSRRGWSFARSSSSRGRPRAVRCSYCPHAAAAGCGRRLRGACGRHELQRDGASAPAAKTSFSFRSATS